MRGFELWFLNFLGEFFKYWIIMNWFKFKSDYDQLIKNIGEEVYYLGNNN